MTDETIERALYNADDIAIDECVDCCDVYKYIQRLKAENERLKQSDTSKENCTIEQHAEIHKLRDELKQARQDTAKEIYEIVKEVQRGVGGNHYVNPDSVIAMEIRAKYGIEV